MKVFAIGSNKTGTTSLRVALTQLGFGPCTRYAESEYLIGHWLAGQLEAVFDLIHRYNAFQDAPFSYGALYKDIFERYPNAKYILTVRDEEKWFSSFLHWHTHVVRFGEPGRPDVWQPYCVTYGMATDTPMSPENIRRQKSVIIDAYNRRNQDIIGFFPPDKLLVIDLSQEPNPWIPLCRFLEIDPPSVTFPHENKTRYGPLL